MASPTPPRYPVSDGSIDDRPPEPGARWGARLAIAAVVALVVLLFILHLSGVVGPGAH